MLNDEKNAKKVWELLKIRKGDSEFFEQSPVFVLKGLLLKRLYVRIFVQAVPWPAAVFCNVDSPAFPIHFFKVQMKSLLLLQRVLLWFTLFSILLLHMQDA